MLDFILTNRSTAGAQPHVRRPRVAFPFSPPVAKSFALLLACFVFAGCSARKGTAVRAEVIAVEDARSIEDEPPPPVPALPAISATQLSEHEHYRVPAGKTAAISFVAGIFGVAHHSAEIDCNALRLQKDGNETSSDAMLSREVEVHVNGGAVTFSQPWRDVTGQSNLKVNVGAIVVTGALGSLFHVSANGDSIRVTCVRRAVNVSTSTGQMEIGPGQFFEANAGRAASPAPAANDAQAQQALQIALADEERIGQFIVQKRQAIPAWRHP